jgi:hypothetical protein
MIEIRDHGALVDALYAMLPAQDNSKNAVPQFPTLYERDGMRYVCCPVKSLSRVKHIESNVQIVSTSNPVFQKIREQYVQIRRATSASQKGRTPTKADVCRFVLLLQHLQLFPLMLGFLTAEMQHLLQDLVLFVEGIRLQYDPPLTRSNLDQALTQLWTRHGILTQADQARMEATRKSMQTAMHAVRIVDLLHMLRYAPSHELEQNTALQRTLMHVLPAHWLNHPDIANEQPQQPPQKRALAALRMFLDTSKCTALQEDDDVLGRRFDAYTLQDLDSFVVLEGGFCFSCEYLGRLIVGNHGKLLGLKGAGAAALSEETIRYTLVPSLSVYYARRPEARKADLQAFLDTYTGVARETVQHWIDTPPSTEKQLSQFFGFMLEQLADAIVEKGVDRVVDASGQLLMDLFALYGFTLYADEVTVWDNTCGKHFEISTYCTGVLLSCLEQLDHVMVAATKKQQRTSLAQLVRAMDAGDDLHIESMLRALKDTCVHGVGNTFMRFYVRAIKALKRHAAFRLAPVLIPVPAEIQKQLQQLQQLQQQQQQQQQQTDIAYLTCIPIDGTEHDPNPLNMTYLVIGYSEEGEAHKLLQVQVQAFKSTGASPMLTAKDYMDMKHTVEEGLQLRVTESANASVAELFIQHYMKGLQHPYSSLFPLLRIAHVFAKERKATFKAYADYALHVCRLRHASTPRAGIAHLCAQKVMDMITLEEASVPAEQCIVLVGLAGGPKASILLGWDERVKPADLERRDNVHLTTLDTLLSLNYTAGGRVMLSERGVDVTDAYQSAKLLAKIVPTSAGAPLSKHPYAASHQQNRFAERLRDQFTYFENYYLNLFGTSSAFRQALFKDIYIQTDDGTRYDAARVHRLVQASGGKKNASPLVMIVSNQLKRLDALTVTDVLRALWPFRKLTSPLNVKELVQTCIDRMTVTLALLHIFYSGVVPINDRDFEDLTRQDPIGQLTFILRDSTLHQRLDQYELVLWNILATSSKEGMSPASAHLHFTEIDETFYFTQKLQKDLKARLTRKAETSNADRIRPVGAPRTPAFIQKYDASLKWLNRNVSYYRDVPDQALRLRDYQDSMHVRMAAVMKAELLDTHLEKMRWFYMAESLVLHVINLGEKEEEHAYAWGMLSNATYQDLMYRYLPTTGPPHNSKELLQLIGQVMEKVPDPFSAWSILIELVISLQAEI